MRRLLDFLCVTSKTKGVEIMNEQPLIVQKQERLRLALQHQLYGSDSTSPNSSSSIVQSATADPSAIVPAKKRSYRALIALPVLGIVITGSAFFYTQTAGLRGASVITPTASPTATVTPLWK